jgi:hypothetical protein
MCTPDLFTWMSEGGCLAAQTAWRKDKRIDNGCSTCLSALVCTPCYLAYLLDGKKGKKGAQVLPGPDAPDADSGPVPKRRASAPLLRPVDSQPGMIRF